MKKKNKIKLKKQKQFENNLAQLRKFTIGREVTI